MLTTLLTTAIFAQAPETSDDVEVIIQKETHVDFGDVEVNASGEKPQIELIVDWTPARPDSLIRLRTSFHTEINSSINTVK